jgi:hypothetical protein
MEVSADKQSRLIKTALQLMKDRNFPKALDYWELCEKLQAYEATPHTKHLVLNNLAVCYQQTNQSEGCLKYLEACQQHLHNLQNVSSVLTTGDDPRLNRYHSSCPKASLPSNDLIVTSLKPSVPGDLTLKVKYERTRCVYKAQACSLLSKLGDHSAALACAEKLIQDVAKLIRLMMKLCTEFGGIQRQGSLGRLNRSADSTSAYSSRPHNSRSQTVVKAGEVLGFLQDFMFQQKPLRVPDLSFRSVIGLQKFDDWIFKLSIGSFMTVGLVTTQETPESVETELSRDNLVRVVCLLSVGLFCAATEQRFMSCVLGDQQWIRGEARHRQSLLLATSLLPIECPLVEHLKVTYTRFYGQPTLKRSKLKRNSRTLIPSPLKSKHSTRSTSPIKFSRSDDIPALLPKGSIRLSSSPYLSGKISLGKKIQLVTKQLVKSAEEVLAYRA